MDKSILIIEDDQNIVEIMIELISRKYPHIDTASNVEDAIKCVNSKNFDIIILDINLEGRNGAEVIKHIVESADNQNKNTPVLISSGIINNAFIKKYQDRFAGIIQKPFDHQEFLNTMEQIISDQLMVENANENNEIVQVPVSMPYTVPQLQVKVSKVLDQVKKSPKLKDLFNKMKVNRSEDGYVDEHIGLVINISTAISIALEWNTEKTLEKFVYSAYLHDMALIDRPDLSKITATKTIDNLKEELNPADYKLIFEHPNMAADVIDSVHEVPPDISLMVRQHHENAKGSGFPNRPTASKISPLATIFIVAHDLSDFIITNPNWTMEKYLIKAKLIYKGQHFHKVLGVLTTLK